MADFGEIHQQLYGYSNGHRLISASTRLERADERTLLGYSDSAVDPRWIPSEGYMTGLPLSNSGVYALCRTWSAPEMSRPGCVWTHVLLLDFGSLATMRFLANVASMFRRPTRDITFETYQKTTSVFENALSALPQVAQVDYITLRELLTASILVLYEGTSRDSILSLGSSSEVQAANQVALAIWTQQWPRLRRSFRFCTLVERDRSSAQHQFDLQYGLNAEARLTGQNVNTKVHMAAQFDAPWVSVAVDGALHQDEKLTDFLWRAGSEVTNSKEIFPQICSLYAAMRRNSGHYVKEEIIGGLSTHLRKNEANFVRNSVLQWCRADFANLSPSTISLLARSFVTDSTSEQVIQQLGIAAWEVCPDVYVGATSFPISRLYDETVKTLDPIRLARYAVRVPEVIPDLVVSCTQILEVEEFWRTLSLTREQLARLTKSDIGAAFVGKAAKFGKLDVIATMLAEMEPLAAIPAVLSPPSPYERQIGALVDETLSDHDDDLAHTLIKNAKSMHELRTLTYSNRAVSLDSTDRDDPWLLAVGHLTSSEGLDPDVALACVTRALMESSSEQFSLLDTSLDSALEQWDAINNRELKHALQTKLRGAEGRAGVLRGVARLLIRKRPDVTVLIGLTSSTSTLETILEQLAGLSTGRSLLRKYTRELKNIPEALSFLTLVQRVLRRKLF